MSPDYLVRDCGCRELYYERGTGKEEKLAGLCYHCRTARIGETIEFIRFGVAPESGCSTNHRDRTAEVGLSVYEVEGSRAVLVGFFFDIVKRPAFLGSGVITGWGSDGEPLVAIESISKLSRAKAGKLIDGYYKKS